MTKNNFNNPAMHEATQPSCAIAYINTVLDTGESLGVDRLELLDGIGLTTDDTTQPNNRVPMDLLITLLNKGAELSNTPDFGLHVGSHIKAGSFGLLGYLIMCSRNMREATELMFKFRRIVFDAGQTLLDEDGENTIYCWHPLKPEFNRSRYLVDAIFSGWVCFSRLIGQGELAPVRVEFSYAKPDDLTLHRQLFGDELFFGQAKNRLYVSTERLAQPLPQANADIFATLNEQARTFLYALNAQASVVDEVRYCLFRLLPKGDANIDTVAETMHITRRTLQRKLSAESTQFKHVLNGMREDLSEQYLNDKDLSMLDIALLLGFSDNSAFTSWFRAWKAMSPSEYRETIPDLS